MNTLKITYKIECLPEETEFDGYFSDIDKEADAAQTKMIREQLEAGNQWAWCAVKVTATIDGIPELEGVDYLGCCSYKSESDFMSGDNYLRDMQETALDDLLTKVKLLKQKLSSIEVKS